MPIPRRTQRRCTNLTVFGGVLRCNLQLSSLILLASSWSPKQEQRRSFDARLQQNAENAPILSKELPQNDQDRQLERWFVDHGILMGPNKRRRIQLSSTKQSVGGRGLFLVPPTLASDPDSVLLAGVANQGDILAYIPGDLVLEPSTVQAAYPCLFHDNDFFDSKDADGKYSWQTILTTCVWKALYESPTQSSMQHIDVCEETGASSSRRTPNWREWVENWKIDGLNADNNGQICAGGHGPRPLQDYTSEAVETMARLTLATESQVRDVINAKHKTFELDWSKAKKHLTSKQGVVGNAYLDDKQRKQDFIELYTSVLSRTANLGPEWGYQQGIIPLHDMCNHPPWGQEANVELMCVGDVRSFVGNDGLKHLIRPLLTQEPFVGDHIEAPIFKDHDFVLAAQTRIDPHQELFLNYNSNKGDMTPQEQVCLLLQYGFPFRPCQTSE